MGGAVFDGGDIFHVQGRVKAALKRNVFLQNPKARAPW
jgi:hypothetical protein